VKAADTIYDRFLELFPDQYPAPERLLLKRPQSLRKAGISRQKAGYLRNVAAFAQTEGMAYEKVHRMNDEEVIAYLTQIKGVGQWTVEMLLMFPLGRPDVLPVADLGIQQVMAKLYRLRVQGPKLKERMVEIADTWRPYRSVACKYLWRAKDGT
jgi:DNA-3-methyladenine glycosylase II